MGLSFREEMRQAIQPKSNYGLYLKELPVTWTIEKPQRAEAKFYYFALRDSLPTTSEFIKLLEMELVNFCLPRSELMRAKEQYRQTNNPAVFYSLVIKAKRLFIKTEEETKRSGEGGELILFLLLEEMGAPQIVSKMYLKTSASMPVHGSDGLHIGYDEKSDILTIYLGESKLHADYSNALSTAVSSISDLNTNVNKLTRELELVTSVC